MNREKKRAETVTAVRHSGGKPRLVRLRKNAPYLLMLLIPVVYFLLFCYWPMFGISMAFQDYKVGAPFLGAGTKWVGFKWFERLLSSPMFPRLLRRRRCPEDRARRRSPRK